jgi:hypothetical protein
MSALIGRRSSPSPSARIASWITAARGAVRSSATRRSVRLRSLAGAPVESSDGVFSDCLFAVAFFTAELEGTCVGQCGLGAVAMRRVRGAAIVVTAMAIRRALIAHVGLALVRTKLLARFCFAGTSVVPAFHNFHLEAQCRQKQSTPNEQILCHSMAASRATSDVQRNMVWRKRVCDVVRL